MFNLAVKSLTVKVYTRSLVSSINRNREPTHCRDEYKATAEPIVATADPHQRLVFLASSTAAQCHGFLAPHKRSRLGTVACPRSSASFYKSVDPNPTASVSPYEKTIELVDNYAYDKHITNFPWVQPSC
jgi:hypothetical protein